MGLCEYRFLVERSQIEDAENPALKSGTTINYPRQARGFSFKVEAVDCEDYNSCEGPCSDIRYVSVIGSNNLDWEPEVDSKRKTPFYHGARTDGDDAWFDAPMSGGWGPNGFGWDKATFHLEICAYCADDGKFNLLGCIRFDYMSDKSNNKFKFFGGEPYGDGGIRQKVHKPTRMYNDAMKRWEKKHNEGHPFFE
jgi:hypothetical protein